MKELVEILAKSLVDNPDQVVVKEIVEANELRYELNVAETDMGKVIGKQGRIAKALRIVLKAAANKEQKRVSLDIV
jgi:hypothetical protein